MLEGKCHKCTKWIGVEGVKEGEAKVSFSHAAPNVHSIDFLDHCSGQGNLLVSRHPVLLLTFLNIVCVGGSMPRRATKAPSFLANVISSQKTLSKLPSTPYHSFSFEQSFLPHFPLMILSKSRILCNGTNQGSRTLLCIHYHILLYTIFVYSYSRHCYSNCTRMVSCCHLAIFLVALCHSLVFEHLEQTEPLASPKEEVLPLEPPRLSHMRCHFSVVLSAHPSVSNARKHASQERFRRPLRTNPAADG